MTNTSIAVVGSYLVGKTIEVPRFPVPGETLIGGSYMKGPGGKGANQAIGTSRLGAETTFVSKVGDDSYGQNGIDLLRDEGLTVEHTSVVTDNHTAIAFIMVDEQGENQIVLSRGALDELTATDVQKAEAEIKTAETALIQLEIPTAAATAAVRIAHKHGLNVILNPAPARQLPRETLAKVDYLTPNESEARILAGLNPDSDENNETVARKLKDLGVDTVVMTLGEDGALIVDNDGTQRVPAPTVDVVDTTGAGDAFNAGFAVALSEDLNVEEATMFGCKAGGYNVTEWEVVPAMPYRDDINGLDI